MGNEFIDHYGETHQMKQLVKECIELAHVLNDFLDGKDSLDHVQEEMGDVDNLIGQFQEHFGDGKIYCWVAQKQERQRERMRNEIIQNRTKDVSRKEH